MEIKVVRWIGFSTHTRLEDEVDDEGRRKTRETNEQEREGTKQQGQRKRGRKGGQQRWGTEGKDQRRTRRREQGRKEEGQEGAQERERVGEGIAPRFPPTEAGRSMFWSLWRSFWSIFFGINF